MDGNHIGIKKMLPYFNIKQMKTKFRSEIKRENVEVMTNEKREIDISPESGQRMVEKPWDNQNGKERVPPKVNICTVKLLRTPSHETNQTKITGINNQRRTALDPYTKIYLFEDACKIYFFDKQKHNGSILVILSAQKMYPVHCVFEKGPRPKLI